MKEDKKKYRETAEQAAELERAGKYEEAASRWMKASLLTTNSAVFNWCNARAQFCQRMAVRPFKTEEQ